MVDFSLASLADPNVWVSFLTLAVLEIVLGIDNIVFISILAGRLPEAQRARARQIGLALALLTRLALLASIAWIASLTATAFTLFDHPVSWRDLVLIGGGLFLLYKATFEMHAMVEGEHGDTPGAGGVAGATFFGVITQIAILDIVFSLDSVITAVGLADELWVMAGAIIVAVIVMLVAINPISAFVEKHPTVKMLALAFLIMVGAALVADGAGFHIPRGYLYFAMAFSGFVEVMNQLARGRAMRRVGARHGPPAPEALRDAAGE